MNRPVALAIMLVLWMSPGTGLLHAQEGAAPPPSAPAPLTITLGEFAVKVATQLQLAAPSGALTPEGAAWALLQKGVRLRPELGSPLVEGDVVGILTGLGYHIRTTTPSRVMTRDRLDAIVTVFFPNPTAPAP